MVSPSKLATKRALWRSWTRAAVFGTLALTLIFGAGPLIKWRRAARAPRAVVAATVAIVATAVAARALLWLAMSPLIGRALDAPLALLPNALLLAGIAWLAIDSLERWRVGSAAAAIENDKRSDARYGRDRRHFSPRSERPCSSGSYERLLRSIAVHSSFDLLHFSLHPIEATRLCVAFGLVLLHAAVIWLAAAILRAPDAWLRLPRTSRFIAVRSAPRRRASPSSCSPHDRPLLRFQSARC